MQCAVLLTVPSSQSETQLSSPSTAMLVLRTEMAATPPPPLLLWRLSFTSCSREWAVPYWSSRTESRRFLSELRVSRSRSQIYNVLLRPALQLS